MQREQHLKVGDVHRAKSKPITTTQLVMYAGASGDFNRIHFDEPFSREVGLPGVIAHGMLTMAIAGSCITEMAGEVMRVVDFSSRFLSPVRVGDVVETMATVTEHDEGHGLGVAVISQVGDRIVLKGEARLARQD